MRQLATRWTVPVALLALAGAFLLSTTDGTAEEEGSAARKDVLGLIAPREGEVIADLGCGTGTWTFELARAVGEHGRVYAVDIDPGVLQVVRERKARDRAANVEILQSLPDDPKLPKNALDAVFLNDVIDVVERRALVGFLAGIRVALKPAGRLIIRDPNGGPDRVIAECYRAGFTLVEAKIPLRQVPSPSFSTDWYALKLRRGDLQHAILPRLGRPERYRTRLHLAEELFRAGLIPREELRSLWQTISTQPGDFDPATDEPRDLIRAAASVGVLSPERAAELGAK